MGIKASLLSQARYTVHLKEEQQFSSTEGRLQERDKMKGADVLRSRRRTSRQGVLQVGDEKMRKFSTLVDTVSWGLDSYKD